MKIRLNQLSILFATIGSILLFLGCSKDEEPRFSMSVEVFVAFPAEFNTIATHTIELFSLPNFINTRLAQNSMTADQVTSIVAGRGQIIPVSPNVQYQLINNVVVNVSSVDNDDLNEMYYNDFIEFDHNGSLELLSSISELKNIMLDGVFDLQVKYNLRQSLLTETEHKLRFDLLIFD
ncbi:hypothetical protein N9O51_02995 [Saprospiraceae bacterium]|nr:hypothetical protein [Saprospiraceae bacterium]